jgi:hypothetical protein
MALIRKVDFVRSKNYSIAFVSELGASLAEGDQLEDVVNSTKHRVLGRNLSLRRSQATEALLHWSREASVAFEGKCEDLVGRILFDGPSDLIRCLRCDCAILDKDGGLPQNVPIVGAVRLDDYDCPAVLMIDDDLVCHIAFIAKSSVQPIRTLAFVAQNPEQHSVHVRLTVKRWEHAKEDGEIIRLGRELETVQYI